MVISFISNINFNQQWIMWFSYEDEFKEYTLKSLLVIVVTMKFYFLKFYFVTYLQMRDKSLTKRKDLYQNKSIYFFLTQEYMLLSFVYKPSRFSQYHSNRLQWIFCFLGLFFLFLHGIWLLSDHGLLCKDTEVGM